jgi:hypothetical protein
MSLIATELKRRRWTPQKLLELRKGDPGKVAITQLAHALWG